MNFSVSNRAILVFQAKYIIIKIKQKKLIYTIKILIFLLSTTLANFLLLIILTYYYSSNKYKSRKIIIKDNLS